MQARSAIDKAVRESQGSASIYCSLKVSGCEIVAFCIEDHGDTADRRAMYLLPALQISSFLIFLSSATSNHVSERAVRCLEMADAEQVADNFAILLIQYSDKQAIASLSENVTTYSDSISTMINNGCQNGIAVRLLNKP